MTEEDRHQIALLEWAAFTPELATMFHVPNGGSRHKLEAVKLRRMGVKPGVYDLVLPLPAMQRPLEPGEYAGLFLEMKSQDGRLSQAQRAFGERVARAGYMAAEAHGVSEAIEIVSHYLTLVKRGGHG